MTVSSGLLAEIESLAFRSEKKILNEGSVTFLPWQRALVIELQQFLTITQIHGLSEAESADLLLELDAHVLPTCVSENKTMAEALAGIDVHHYGIAWCSLVIELDAIWEFIEDQHNAQQATSAASLPRARPSTLAGPPGQV